MAVKTQKPSETITEPIESSTPIGKPIESPAPISEPTPIPGSVEDLEAKLVRQDEEISRRLEQYDADSTPANYALLRTARAELVELEEQLAAARRRQDIRTAADKAKARQAVVDECQAEIAANLKYGIEDIEPWLKQTTKVIHGFLDRRAKLLEKAAECGDGAALHAAQQSRAVLQYYLDRALLPLKGVKSSVDLTGNRQFHTYLPIPKKGE